MKATLGEIRPGVCRCTAGRVTVGEPGNTGQCQQEGPALGLRADLGACCSVCIPVATTVSPGHMHGCGVW